MRNKAVEKFPNALEFVSESYETEEMCDKVIAIYFSTIIFVSECIMTQEMCDKAVNRCFFCI